MMPETKQKIYFNQAQLETILIGAHTTAIIAGRGFGKSEGIDSTSLLRDIQYMPRGTHAILSPTYKKLLQNTLPAACVGLSRLGYRRNEHYYIGRKAPDSMGFRMPYYEPYDWEHFMHWYNGSVVQLVSFDVPMSLNSKTIDSVKGFEAKFLNYKKMETEVFQANRGNVNIFGNIPWHHGYCWTTDMPTNKTGEWLFGFQDQMDMEVIDAIKDIVYKKKKLLAKKELSKTYIERELKKLNEDLRDLRKNAVYYAEYSAIDNIDILGEKYIADMKRILPPVTFLTSILNKRIRKLYNGFYASMSENIHYYSAANNSVLSSIGYNYEKYKGVDCRYDSELIDDKPLCIACDYNANINWMVVGQHDGRVLRTVNSLYVKNERKLRELCKDFNEYYRFRHTKDITYYYDSTAIKSAYADEEAEAFYEIVINVLTKLGWNVNPIYIGNPMAHNLKHQYIDDGFKGVKYLFPMFNKYNNEELLQAMEQTGVKVGRNGFEKDKSGEKLMETIDDPLQLRTDGTDAWDTLWLGCVFFPQNGSGIYIPTAM
jgi:hypothetical protein